MAAPQETVKMDRFGYTTDLVGNRTVNLAAGITRADEGKALTLDATGPNKFKLAGANDAVYGRLEIVENRVNEGTLVGTAKLLLMGVQLPIQSGQTVAVGDFVVGGAAGAIKKEGVDPARPSRLYVVEIKGTNAVVYSL